MKNKKEIISIFLIITFLIYIINNISKINGYIIYAASLWFYKVFPFLFIMIIINKLLISNNILFYLNKICKKNGLKYYVLFMSLLSGSPTSALIIKELYTNKIIDLKDANKMLIFTYFSNPIFLLSMLNNLFNKNIIIIIILAHYITNFIICFFLKIKPNQTNLVNKQSSFNTILNHTINTCLMVLGTLTFYIVISNIIIHILNISSVNSVILKGLLEITQGLNEIPNLFINNKLKYILTIIIINFGGLSIHSQIKSIISDTSISYKYFLFGRIIQIIGGIIIMLF